MYDLRCVGCPLGVAVATAIGGPSFIPSGPPDRAPSQQPPSNDTKQRNQIETFSLPPPLARKQNKNTSY